MSHISRIRTKMVEQKYVLQALDDLNCTYKTGSFLGKGSIKIRNQGVTFRKAGNTYECVADSDRVSRVKQQNFVQNVTQRYAYHATRAKLEAQGFSLVEEQVQDGSRIHLRLRRMV